MHCLLINNESEQFPYFITEALAELLTNELFEKNPYIEKNIYPLEIVSLKLLFEILPEDIVIDSYTRGDINIIYDELTKLNPKIDSKAFISELNSLLYNFKTNYEVDAKQVISLHSIFESYYNQTNKNEEDQAFKYYLELFDTLKSEKPLSTYLKIVKQKYIPKCYINKQRTKSLCIKRIVDT